MPVCVPEVQTPQGTARETCFRLWLPDLRKLLIRHPDPKIPAFEFNSSLDYLDEKRGTLDRSKESTKHTIQKIGGILRPLAAFLRDRGTIYMKDVKTEHLSAFQETWQGRLRKNRDTDEFSC